MNPGGFIHVFILDYSGTLTTLKNPAAFLMARREKYDGCKIVLHTGAVWDSIDEAVTDAVDARWKKPCRLDTKLHDTGWLPKQVIIADDDLFAHRAYERIASFFPCPAVVIGPEGLPGLLNE